MSDMNDLNDLNVQQQSLAVLIDYENIARGMSKKGNTHQDSDSPDIKLILERLVEKGRIMIKRAYSDWKLFENDITPLHELGIELIEIPDRGISGKNSADIRLAVDAVEICLTKSHIDTFAILSGDSDFSPLVGKLKEFGKTVIAVGMKNSTSPLLVEVSDEFIFYEDLVAAADSTELIQQLPEEKRDCFQLLIETIEAMQRENDGFVLASHLKQTMRRKRPQFSETYYGYRSFSELLTQAASLGFIKIHKDPKSGTFAVDGLNR